MFLRVVKAVELQDSYFKQKLDAVGEMGISSIQKCIVVLSNLLMDLVHMLVMNMLDILSETTTMLCLKKIVRAIRELYESQYLRKPSREDIMKQMK